MLERRTAKFMYLTTRCTQILSAVEALCFAAGVCRAPQARDFIRTLRRGDQVEITYTEAVAVEVVPSR